MQKKLFYLAGGLLLWSMFFSWAEDGKSAQDLAPLPAPDYGFQYQFQWGEERANQLLPDYIAALKQRDYLQAFSLYNAIEAVLEEDRAVSNFWDTVIPAPFLWRVTIAQVCENCVSGVCGVCKGQLQCAVCHGSKICFACRGRGGSAAICTQCVCKACRGQKLCARCRGAKKLSCSVCRGTGQGGQSSQTTACPRCKGSGRLPMGLKDVMTCPQCGGRGNIQQTFIGQCATCRGRGWVECPDCHGEGICQACRGRGRISPCNACQDRGVVETPCAICRGARYCPACQGSGTCGFCKGTGKCPCCGGDFLKIVAQLPVDQRWGGICQGYLVVSNLSRVQGSATAGSELCVEHAGQKMLLKIDTREMVLLHVLPRELLDLYILPAAGSNQPPAAAGSQAPAVKEESLP